MKQNNIYVIGVTGGVGSGKSLALEYLFEKYGCILLKADDYGNEVKLKGNECYKAIVELLGEEILDDNGEIIKSKMSDKIFGNDKLIAKVNSIIHPAVRKRIETEISKGKDKDIFVIEAALLVEADYFDVLNELWEIKSDEELRIKRLIDSRGYSLEKCRNIISSQHDTFYYMAADFAYREKTSRKDYYGFKTILNNSSREDLYRNIDRAMGEIYERFGQLRR